MDAKEAHSPSENEIAIARLFIDKLASKQSEAGKWLLASLLVINGGALIALFSNESVGPVMLKAAAGYFVTGIVLSLATGAASYAVSEMSASLYLDKIGVRFNFAEEPIDPIVKNKAYGFFVAVMVLAALGSLGSFIAGSIAASDAAYANKGTEEAEAAQRAADNAMNAADAAMNAALSAAENAVKQR